MEATPSMPATPDELPAEPEAPPFTSAERKRLSVLLVVVVASYIAAFVGSTIAPTLLKTHPALLLALSSRNRHLLFTVAAHIGVVPYSVIPPIRIGVAAAAYFLLGRDFGHRGLAWVDRQLEGRPSAIRWLEKAMDSAGPIIVAVLCGHNVVWMLAGLRRMSAKVFATAMVIGLAGRLVFFWAVGKRYEKQLTKVIDWIARYQWWLVGALLAVSVAQSVIHTSRSKRR